MANFTGKGGEILTQVHTLWLSIQQRKGQLVSRMESDYNDNHVSQK